MAEFNLHSILMLKGPALAVFNLLLFSDGSVSQTWLQRNSGYSDKPVTQACLLLKELGLVQRSYDGWVLARDLTLPNFPRRNSGPISSLNPSESDSLNKDQNTKNSPRNFSEPAPEAEEDPERAEMWRILSGAGVYRNDRTRDLLRMPHINAAYLRAKVEEYANQERSGPKFAGLLVRALEDGEPAEARSENGHGASCGCVHCQIQRLKGR